MKLLGAALWSRVAIEVTQFKPNPCSSLFNAKAQRSEGAKKKNRQFDERGITPGGCQLVMPAFSVGSPQLASLPLCSAIAQHRRVLRRFFDAEDAKVGAEERGGEFSLRPSREPLRPLRSIRPSGILVVASPRYALALNSDGIVPVKMVRSSSTPSWRPADATLDLKAGRVTSRRPLPDTRSRRARSRTPYRHPPFDLIGI
jgi:hypothetical protein